MKMTTKKPNKSELEDEVLKIITNRYFAKNQFVWFMDKNKCIYDGKTLATIQSYYGLAPFIHDPINDKHGRATPNEQSWYEGIITDCIEHIDGRIARANIVRFAMSCLMHAEELKRLTIIVKKGMGLEKDDVIELAYFANAKKVWEPTQFEKVEDRICVAAR